MNSLKNNDWQDDTANSQNIHFPKENVYLDEKVIQLVGDEFIPPDNLRKGAPGKQLWTFRRVGAVETTISLEYLRPWEKGKPPARTKTFSIAVTSPTPE